MPLHSKIRRENKIIEEIRGAYEEEDAKKLWQAHQ